MTGEVYDTFNGRTLFYLDKKQFIVLQNLESSNLLCYKIYNSFSHKVETPLLLRIYLFHWYASKLGGMWTVGPQVDNAQPEWLLAEDC